MRTHNSKTVKVTLKDVMFEKLRLAFEKNPPTPGELYKLQSGEDVFSSVIGGHKRIPAGSVVMWLGFDVVGSSNKRGFGEHYSRVLYGETIHTVHNSVFVKKVSP